MRLRFPLLAFFLATAAAADTSPRIESVDPQKFGLVRSLPGPRASLLSADGRFLLSFGGNNGKLFDIVKGKEIADLQGHTANIHDGYFSDDGRRVVTAGYDGTVRIWDTSTGEELHSISAHAGYA